MFNVRSEMHQFTISKQRIVRRIRKKETAAGEVHFRLGQQDPRRHPRPHHMIAGAGINVPRMPLKLMLDAAIRWKFCGQLGISFPQDGDQPADYRIVKFFVLDFAGKFRQVIGTKKVGLNSQAAVPGARSLQPIGPCPWPGL